MSGALHIARKDLKRLRWLLVLWIAILAARVALAAGSAAPAEEASTASALVRQLSGVVLSLELLLGGLLVARVVHDEPLVGLNAFWLTRPYPPRALLGAKLGLVALFLMLCPLAADLVTLRLFNAGTAALIASGSTAAVDHATWALTLMILAALTPSLGVFILTLIGLAAGLALLIVVGLAVAVFMFEQPSGYATPAAADATSSVVSAVIYLVAAVSVVIYQYRRGRTRVAVALVVAGLAASLVVPDAWPWRFARAAEIDPGGWARTTAPVHDRAQGLRVNEQDQFGLGGGLRRQINGRVTLTGMPAEVSAESIAVRGTLRFEDGTTLSSQQMEGFTPHTVLSAERPAPQPILAALRGVTLLTSFEGTYGLFEPWPALITMSEEEYIRHRGRSGRLEANLDFYLSRTRELGALPLRDGAALDDGVSRVELVAVRQRGDGYTVAIRAWRARAPWMPHSSWQLQYVLRNPVTRTALTANHQPGWPLVTIGGMSAMALPFALMAGDFSAGSSSNGFDVDTQVLQFPHRSGQARADVAPVDRAWYEGAELVVLETVAAGTVTRALTIEDFIVPQETR